MNVRVLGSKTITESASSDDAEPATLFLLACDKWVPGAEEMRFLFRGFVMGISNPRALAPEGLSLVLGLPLLSTFDVAAAWVNHDPWLCVYLLFEAAVLVWCPSLLIGLEKFLEGLDGVGSSSVFCSSNTLDNLFADLGVP